jgi:ATP-dependent DNA helicase RecG
MSAAEKTPAELLATPVQYVKGVGPQRAELLQRLGLRTAADVLFHFPRDYQDLTDQRQVHELEEGKLQSVRGTVEEIDQHVSGSGRHVLGVLVRAETGYLRCLWFNQPFLREKFFFGQRVMVSGKPRYRGMVWEMSHPRVETLADDEEEPVGKILPVYPLTEGLLQWQMRRIVRAAMETYAALLEEAFPDEFLQAHDLWPLRRALPEVHFPGDRESLEKARRRLVYQELLQLQLALAVKRRQQHDLRRAPRLEPTAKIDARIRKLFPFELTPGQEQAIAEIARDMARPLPMNRLLQGEVGSGKTVVAVYAILLAVAGGCQAVMMAPTEVLARQHALTLDRMLAESRVRRASLTGGLTAKQRAELLAKIAAGEIDVVTGTQAVIQDDVEFKNLGLVVIDEQHKFGVRQRARLKQAGLDPHYLVMTATPIPRTVTLTLFGDLDVSTLRDNPPGRQPVHTYLVPEPKRAAWWEFFRKKLREGRQGYVVAPLIDESDDIAAASLAETFESLANGELEAFRLGLIHGRLSSAEKEAVMDRFRRGDIQVLVSTPVIEVGVDVPNATLMTIEGGQRFGLSQLHQLRGRIRRGRFPGFCGVFADPQTEESKERLKAFAESTDGFALAETDFRLRGPGEILGTRQHGLPPLRIADLLRDAAVLDEARRDAQALVAADPGLARPEHARLRCQVLARYGKALDLGDVG